MKRELAIKGDSVEQKIKSIEAVLRRMGRRLNQKVIGIMPVSPIFNFIYAPKNGETIMRLILPAKGMITKGAFHFDLKGKKPITIIIEIEDFALKSSVTQSYIVTRQSNILDINFPVNAGSKMTMKIRLQENEMVEGIWIGVLYEVDFTELGSKEFFLKEFDSMIEEDLKCLSE